MTQLLPLEARDHYTSTNSSGRFRRCRIFGLYGRSIGLYSAGSRTSSIPIMAKAGTLGRLAGIAYNLTPRRSRRARLIHTYHGHVFEGYFNGVSTRLFLIVERWLAKRTDVLVAISPHVANDLLHTYR